MWPWNTRHVRFWGLSLFGVAAALFVLGLVPGWGLAAQIDFVGGSAAAIAFLCWLAWQLVTGRLGLIHREPTARRRRRLERRAAAKAQAEALAQQKRLDAALSHGSYRPEPGPPAADERAR